MRGGSRRRITGGALISVLAVMALAAVSASPVASAAVHPFPASPGTDHNFEGLRSNLNGADPLNWGDDYVPATRIGVGPDDVVEVVNDAVGIFTKGGTLQSAQNLTDLFAGSTSSTCAAANSDGYTDSHVFYDSAHDRWLIALLAEDPTDGVDPPYNFEECIAASRSGNPEGAFNFYDVPISSGNLYPASMNLGLWINDTLWGAAQIECGDLTCPGAGTANDDVEGAIGNRVWAFNTADMESGAALRWATSVGTGNLLNQIFPGGPGTTTGPYADVLTPATYNTASGIPPTGRNEYFTGVDYNSGTGLQDVWRTSVTWTGTPTITVTGPKATQVNLAYHANYSFTDFSSQITEPAPGNVLDTQYDYTTGQVVYSKVGVNERLWFAHEAWTTTTAPTTGSDSVFWGEMSVKANGAPKRAASAPVTGFSPDATNRFLPALGVDKLGNMAVGYNVASSTVYPGIRYAGRLTTDAVGTLGQTEASLQEGSGYQVGASVPFDPDFPLFTQWGGDATMTLDPDGCTFWFGGEYLSSSPALPTDTASDTWNTKIGAWHYAGCTPTALPTALSSVSGAGPQGSSSGTLTATLKSTGTSSGVYGKTVSFKLSGTPVGTAVTDDNGVATLSGVDISALSAGSHAGVVSASFAGTSAFGAAGPTTGDLMATGGTAQTITFANPGAKTFGAADFALGGTASSGLSVSYTATGDCTVSGSNAHLLGGGSCTVTAHQGGNGTFAPASDVARTFAVNKGTQTISFSSALPSIIGNPTDKTPPAAGQTYLSATSTSGLPVTFTTNSHCTLSGVDHVYGTSVGTCTVTAHQDGSDDYLAASTVAQSSSIAAPTPATTTTVLAKPKKPKDAHPFALAVTVTSAGDTPTGTVEFFVDGASVGTATLDSLGKASFTVTVPTAGVHTFQATLQPNTWFATSSSLLLSVNLK